MFGDLERCRVGAVDPPTAFPGRPLCNRVTASTVLSSNVGAQRLTGGAALRAAFGGGQRFTLPWGAFGAP